MNDEQIWQLRSVNAAIAALQNEVVIMLADRKVTDNRVRDFKRNCQHLIERIDGVVEAGNVGGNND